MFLIPHPQIKNCRWVKWARHSQTEFLLADILISLAICHRDEKKKQKGEKEKFTRLKKRPSHNCTAKPENAEINSINQNNQVL